MAGEHCLSKFLCSLLHFGELDWGDRVIASVQQHTPLQTNSGQEADGKPGDWGGGEEGDSCPIRRGVREGGGCTGLREGWGEIGAKERKGGCWHQRGKRGC